ncbi:class I SAM-dependent methyltransferase [Mariniflexile maritimum]|jgi:SAM-dependent methyltransferase|uniref:class I SAM-dependent methyltransferase n=1 Tax=Mariniflexile maritimum TaxID=2682493 RepID=UPI0012F67738|nr:class I SAM-dependent methyltransferase [Mariniflexile maritimum]MCB0450894.1 class I SAM-dependent methyltransferase [Confluentibacter sp.]HMQ44992.1 class I SAM-dependent methyltransferase [Mariniflexile sp.]
MNKDTTTWFTSWFDTPFYHILYKDRDDTEAQHFMDKLTGYLNIPEGGSILDLACGKGRHSIYLNSLGFDVTGADLSENSIGFAKQYENDTLHFKVHNMCKPFNKPFDAVFNLFTSFGYFESDADNLSTIKAIKADLNASGFGVIDFMNSDFVMANLVPEEVKTVQGINFHLKRYVKDGFIIKDINFTANGKDYCFHEQVRAFTLADFEKLFDAADAYLLDVFGDYKLSKFNKNTSERLVMIFK